MEQILFLAHTEADGSLGKAALEALTLAVELAAKLNAGLQGAVLGSQTQAGSNTLAGTCAKVFSAEHPEFVQPRYATDAAAAEALCRAASPTVVIAPATSRWNRVLPGVAFRLGGRVDTHVTGAQSVNGTLQVTRWYYRQRIEASLQRPQRPWVLLVDPGVYPAFQPQLGTVQAETVNVALSEKLTRTRTVGLAAVGADSQTIRPDAKLLFVAGAGWTKKQADGQTHPKDAEQIIVEFLRATRASLGSSKSLVDLGSEGEAVLPFLTHLNQIGQTGATPRHPKGLATCCHGEEPHTVGWRFINERRAVNLDANCGWARGKADVLYVADAFAVMRHLNELLGK